MLWESRITVSIAVCALLHGAAEATAGTIRHDMEDALYQGLAADPAYDAVGKVTWSEAGKGFLGSGTYIGNGWVLTAAHVADGTDFAGGEVSNWKFNLDGDVYRADEFIIHPEWTSSEGNLNLGVDLALVKLSEPATDVTPAVLYALEDERNYIATLVGYGATGDGLTGHAETTSGEKRAGQNQLDAAGGSRRVRSYSDNLLFSDFDNPDDLFDSTWGSRTPLELEYMTAPGDSGGGAFIDVDGFTYLAGVTSFGLALDGTIDASYGDFAAYTRVARYVDWIEEMTGLVAMQLNLPLAGDFNGSGEVDVDDLTVWNDAFGVDDSADADGDGDSDGADLLFWQRAFDPTASPGVGGSVGGVAEPTSLSLLASLALAWAFHWRLLRASRRFCRWRSLHV